MIDTPKISPEVMEAAFEWRAVMADDEVSTAQRRAFSVWLLADPAHRVAYERAEAFWHGLGGIDRAALDEDFFRASWRERVRSALWRIVRGGVSRRGVPTFGALAGACALLLFAVLRLPAGLPEPSPRNGVFSTTHGEVRSVSLEDGSNITLGPATTVTVLFGPDSRRVEMSTGEAFFQVAKDAGRPFTVDSGDLQVTVRGTSFDIKCSESSSEVAVAEGVVSIRHPSLANAGNGPPPGQGAGVPAAPADRTLVAGERFVSRSHSGQARVTEMPPDKVGAWRRKLLVYIDAPLSEIVADMNRYQSRPIRVSDKGIGDIRVTATFNSADIDGMLATLPGVFPVRLEASATGVTILPAQ